MVNYGESAASVLVVQRWVGWFLASGSLPEAYNTPLTWVGGWGRRCPPQTPACLIACVHGRIAEQERECKYQK